MKQFFNPPKKRVGSTAFCAKFFKYITLILLRQFYLTSVLVTGLWHEHFQDQELLFTVAVGWSSPPAAVDSSEQQESSALRPPALKLLSECVSSFNLSNITNKSLLHLCWDQFTRLWTWPGWTAQAFPVQTHSWGCVFLPFRLVSLPLTRPEKLKRSIVSFLVEICLNRISFFKQDMSRNQCVGFKGTNKYCFWQRAVDVLHTGQPWQPKVPLAAGRAGRGHGAIKGRCWGEGQEEHFWFIYLFSTVSGTLILFLERGMSSTHVCSALSLLLFFLSTNSIIVNLKMFLAAIFQIKLIKLSVLSRLGPTVQQRMN